MVDRYFQEELEHLRDLAAEFAASHPALAPLLAGASADPDVERLLEGVAFQNGLLRQKLEDDFPEFIHDLARLVCPQLLRPVPAATLVAFSPSSSAPHTVAAGTQLASVPVEGTPCLFRTCADVELHPLVVTDATFAQPPGEAPAITVSLALNGITVADWSAASLRFFLACDYPGAADLFLLLLRHLRRIVIAPEEDGTPAILSADCLVPAGFDAAEPVIPYPPQTFPGYRLIQEYLTIPQRFLFLDLIGWERWVERGRGERFSVRFELAPLEQPPPRVKREDFRLFVVPAVNLFPHDAEPVRLDHRSDRYVVRPEALPPDHVQIFSVDRVFGLCRGSSRERAYLPFEEFRGANSGVPAYHTMIQPSAIRPSFETYVSVVDSVAGEPPEVDTLSIGLTCTNGDLTRALRIGDLCLPTATSPESVTFANIAPVTPGILPPLKKDLLWRLISNQAINLQSLGSGENLRALLEVYLLEEGRDDPSGAANRRRVEGIEEMACAQGTRLLRGCLVRGTEIKLRVRGDHFAGEGDLFLFGCVLDRFFAGMASLNTFTRLTIIETMHGGTVEWHPRLGDQTLL